MVSNLIDLQIRPAIPEEADRLSQIAFSAKAHWGYPERWLEIWKPELTFSPDYFEQNENWVAETNDQPVAFCTLQEKEGTAWLENLWVSPEWMGKGLGKRLFLHATALARQRGYRELQLEADPNAVGFYRRMGMEQIGERLSKIDGQPRVLPLLQIEL